MKYKVGDWVRVLPTYNSQYSITNKKAKIVKINGFNYRIEFNFSFQKFTGISNLYWIPEKYIQLYREPILKLFLREKNEV